MINDKNMMRVQYSLLLDEYNIVNKKSEHWAYSPYFKSSTLKDHGFKIHISGTITNARKLIELCIPYLINKDINFKVVSTLNALEIQNRGLYGQSQIGKLITVYPSGITELKETLFNLHLITKGYSSPSIPSDFSYRNSKTVYYRYGIFNSNRSDTIVFPNGEVFRDTRERNIPNVKKDVMTEFNIERYPSLPKEYLILEVLRCRGKGSTYKILDLNDKKIKVMKEGIYLGEIEESGIDGSDRSIWESYILGELSSINCTPRVYNKFYIQDNFYFVEDFIEGETLESYCLEKNLSKREIMLLMKNIILVVKKLHDKGVIIRDLSMSNIIINKLHDVHIIDLEFAFKKSDVIPPNIKVGSPGFYNEKVINPSVKDDIYSILCIYYYLLMPKDYSKLVGSGENFKDNKQLYTTKNLDNLEERDRLIINKGLNGQYENLDELIFDFEERSIYE